MLFFEKRETPSYRARQMERIDMDLQRYRFEQEREIKMQLVDARIRAAEEWKEFEHEYHSGRQHRETELAKLDALIEAKKDQLAEKDVMIAYMKGIVTKICDSLNKGENVCNVSNKVS